jgi:MoaA/NifB/PqqE/SkfB family radical SAM enzyme
MRGIEHARGRHRFWTLTVLTRHNLGDVDWLLATADRLGFQASFQVLHHNDKLGRDDGLRPDDPDLRAAVRLLIARKKEGRPIASSLRYLELLLAWPDFAAPRSDRRHGRPPCMAGRLFCNVDVDGKLYPCSLFVDEIDAPDAREAGFAAAFRAMPVAPCAACAAACFTEYNLLYALDWRTGWNWWKALRR